MTSDQSAEKHRQIAFLVEFEHPMTRASGEDVFFGDYIDPEGDRVGRLLHRRGDPEGERALLVPDEAIPLMHVEAALDGDHRVTSYGMVVALIYGPGERPPAAVVETGDRWDAGDLHIFLFEDDESAEMARSSA